MYGGQRRLENDIVLGLYRCICMESLERGNEYLLAVMARGLVTLLRRVGIVFDAIGPEQNYHGLRAPYLGRVETMLEELSRRNPGLYARFMR
jgi:N-acyl amino acid synthase of PEP-CTERM/exosortase system